MKIRHILFAGLAMLTFSACSTDLNQPPVDQLASDGFYKTAAQANQGVLGVYSKLRNLTNDEFLLLSEVRSDNMWANPVENAANEYQSNCMFRSTAESGCFESVWNQWYALIYNANLALQKIPNTTFTDENIKNQFLGEVHFLRGWAYFELARLYGNVPMILEPLSVSAANGVKQTPALEIINNVVIPDLEEALKLPAPDKIVNATGTAVPEEGRANCVAAQAMLARVYMTLAGFPFNDASAKAKAKTYLTQVLANKSKYWAPNITEWRKQWTPDYANKYSIFAIQHRTGGTGNPAIFQFSRAYPPSFTSIRIFGNALFVEKTLRAEFDKVYSNGEKDHRGEGYSFLDGYEAEGSAWPLVTPVMEDVTVDGVTTQTNTEAFFYKYIPTKRKLAELGMSLDESTLKDYYDWPVNFPVLRIEDMMLLYAEILADEGSFDEAMKQVNEIRERAGCDPVSANDKDTAMKYIQRERRIELMGEGVRWFDEIRYGTWQKDIQNMFDRYNNPVGTNKELVSEGRYLCPIPTNQINIVPGLYEQNKGY